MSRIVAVETSWMYCRYTRCWQSCSCSKHSQELVEYCQDLYCSQLAPCPKHFSGEFPELTAPAREFLEKLDGFLRSKQLFDETATRIFLIGSIANREGFPNENLQRGEAESYQKVFQRDQEQKVTAWPQLEAIGNRMLPLFTESMRAFLYKCGLDPNQQLIPEKTVNVLMIGPLKTYKRASEKVEKEYEGDWSLVLDMVRSSIIFTTEEQLNLVVEKFESRQEENITDANNIGVYSSNDSAVQTIEWKTVRFKNRYAQQNIAAGGYRDALFNIQVEVKMRNNTVWSHICEVQLHMLDMYVHKEADHKFYEYFRTYFSGNSSSVRNSMEALREIKDEEGLPIDTVFQLIYQSDNLERLKLMPKLVVEIMGDVRLGCMFQKRIMELENSLESKIMYAEALKEQGDYEDAEKVLIALYKERHEPNSSPKCDRKIRLEIILNLGKVWCLRGKFSDADFLRDCVRECKEIPGNDLQVIDALNEFAGLLESQACYAEAESLYLEALSKSAKCPTQAEVDKIALSSNYAQLLAHKGEYKEARETYEKNLTTSRKSLGNGHWRTLTLMDNLGTLLRKLCDYPNAKLRLHEAVEGRRTRLGSKHPATLTSITHYGILLDDLGLYAEAERLLREAAEGFVSVLGKFHPRTRAVFCSLGNLLRFLNKSAEAKQFLQAAIAKRRKADSSDPHELLQWAETEYKDDLTDLHDQTLVARNNLNLLDQPFGAEGEALERQIQIVAGFRRTLGNQHPETLNALSNLGSFLRRANRFDEAKTSFEEAIKGDEQNQNLGPLHVGTLLTINNLGSLLLEESKLLEAEDYLIRASYGLQQLLGREHYKTCVAFSNLAKCWLKQERFDDAERDYRITLNALKQCFGANHLHTLQGMTDLSLALVALGKSSARNVHFSEAESLTKAVLQCRRQDLGDLHHDVGASLAVLKEIFEAQQRPRAYIRDIELLLHGFDLLRVLGDELVVMQNDKKSSESDIVFKQEQLEKMQLKLLEFFFQAEHLFR